LSKSQAKILLFFKLVMAGLGVLFTHPKFVYRFLKPNCHYRTNIDYNGVSKLDVYEPHGNLGMDVPIILYVHGGIWTLGNKTIYRLLGKLSRIRILFFNVTSISGSPTRPPKVRMLILGL
jgi:acetyl esterase/lipase